jgi:rSAM/selenodomain-associated transferase 1
VNVSVIVVAKEPRPGHAKTRLCPPCTPRQAAALAEAALADTLSTVATLPATRRVLALDGAAGPWLPPGFEIVPQPDGGLADRLAAAFAATGGPAILVGMDTPQITRQHLLQAARVLLEPECDAVLGLASDGGWWCIGLRRPDPRVFDGIPMSTAATGAHQLARLRALRLRTRTLPGLRDVDTFDDASRVAAAIPSSRLGRTFAAVTVSWAGLEPTG